MLLYITKSRSDIMAAVSFAGTKSSHPTDRPLLRRRIPPRNPGSRPYYPPLRIQRTYPILRGRRLIPPPPRQQRPHRIHDIVQRHKRYILQPQRQTNSRSHLLDPRGSPRNIHTRQRHQLHHRHLSRTIHPALAPSNRHGGQQHSRTTTPPTPRSANTS